MGVLLKILLFPFVAALNILAALVKVAVGLGVLVLVVWAIYTWSMGGGA